jgi:hypothetical protein
VVGGRIALRVGFGFDNPAAQTDPEELADDNFADEKAGEGDRICGEFGATEAADGNGGFAGVQGWQEAAVLRGSTEV